MKSTSQKGVIAKKDNFTVEVKYSKKAIDEKLIRFTLTKGNSFEISADELIGIISQQVNTEQLSPALVEVENIDVVEVGRQISCILDKDMKKGEKININYTHPYPLEFAILEEVYKIAKINMDVPAFILTKEYISKTRSKIKPDKENFIKKFYSSFKNLKLKS